MQVSIALLAVVALTAASSTSQPEVQKSGVISSSAQQSYQFPAAVVPYPGQNYQFASEYVNPFAKSAFERKAAPTAVPSSFGVYQSYPQQQQQQQQQQQPHNFGSYQQLYPSYSGYPAVVGAVGGPYPTAYSAQPQPAGAYPAAYYPYGAQPQLFGGYSHPSYPQAAAPASFQPHIGQFAAPSSTHPAGAHYPGVAPYAAQPYVGQQSSFYGSPAGQPYSAAQSQHQSLLQYSAQQQYQPSSRYHPNAAADTGAADPAAKASSAEKK